MMGPATAWLDEIRHAGEGARFPGPAPGEQQARPAIGRVTRPHRPVRPCRCQYRRYDVEVPYAKGDSCRLGSRLNPRRAGANGGLGSRTHDHGGRSREVPARPHPPLLESCVQRMATHGQDRGLGARFERCQGPATVLARAAMVALSVGRVSCDRIGLAGPPVQQVQPGLPRSNSRRVPGACRRRRVEGAATSRVVRHRSVSACRPPGIEGGIRRL